VTPGGYTGRSHRAVTPGGHTGRSHWAVTLGGCTGQATLDWLVQQGGVSVSRLRVTDVDHAPAAAGGSAAPWHVRFHVIQEVTISDQLQFAGGSSVLEADSIPVVEAVGKVGTSTYASWAPPLAVPFLSTVTLYRYLTPLHHTVTPFVAAR
jgi:hypothetical protein